MTATWTTKNAALWNGHRPGDLAEFVGWAGLREMAEGMAVQIVDGQGITLCTGTVERVEHDRDMDRAWLRVTATNGRHAAGGAA